MHFTSTLIKEFVTVQNSRSAGGIKALTASRVFHFHIYNIVEYQLRAELLASGTTSTTLARSKFVQE